MKNTLWYNSHQIERRNSLVVTILENQQSAILLISLIPAVHNLVTPVLNADTLAVCTGELILSTASQLQGQVVGLAFIAV